jgi:RHS repeat-associated protein
LAEEGAAEFTPQFDDDGNQTLIKTATGIWSVTYNGENRPVLWENVSTNSTTPNSSTPSLISMSYDRMGRRVTKNNQRFVYDGYLQIANFELSTLNLELQTFVWDPTEPVATRPLVWNFSTFQPFNLSTSYYTHDGNKNISEVVAVNSDVEAHYECAPFGYMVVQCGGVVDENPWRFSSGFSDDKLGMVYYNYRFYDFMCGKWVRRDPIVDIMAVSEDVYELLRRSVGLDGDWQGESALQNLFVFCRNSPIGDTDIIGLIEHSMFGFDTEWGNSFFKRDCCKEHPKTLIYVSDKPGFDFTETMARLAFAFRYIDMNSVSDFNPNKELGPCECVGKLEVVAHGIAWSVSKGKRDPINKVMGQWGSSDLYEGEDGTTEISDMFKGVRFCKQCKVVLAQCWTANVISLKKRIEANTGCSVTLTWGKGNLLDDALFK